MNTNEKALWAALLLVGETNESINEKWAQYIQKAHVVEFTRVALTNQHAIKLDALQLFAYERINAETQKATFLEFSRLDLRNNPDFIAYQQAVRHARDVAFGWGAFFPGRGFVTTYAEPQYWQNRVEDWDKLVWRNI